MSITRRGPMLVPALLFAASALCAQSVAVSPTTASVAVGGTVQFTKSTNMLSPETVTWSVAGIAGGNSTVGTITTAGLYTAPAAIPAPATLTVTATSTANPAPSASASVTVTAPVPTVKVVPNYISPTVGTSYQLSVQVSNLASSDVTWLAGGVVGGNSTVGTITAAGLYTAPATLPGQNPVTITAISKADNTTNCIGYAYILGLGPTITMATPNPLPVGTSTVTVTGSGFVSGATVLVTGVQLTTKFVSSTTLSGSFYQGPGVSTASVCVRNPGTACGNTLVIPVSGSTTSSGSGSTPPPTPSPSRTVCGSMRSSSS